MMCVLCNEEFDEHEKVHIGNMSFVSVGGHNPAPLAEEGRCCTSCNFKKVLPARLSNLDKELENGSN
jgi:hypothetical protein